MRTPAHRHHAHARKERPLRRAHRGRTSSHPPTGQLLTQAARLQPRESLLQLAFEATQTSRERVGIASPVVAKALEPHIVRSQIRLVLAENVVQLPERATLKDSTTAIDEAGELGSRP